MKYSVLKLTSLAVMAALGASGCLQEDFPESSEAQAKTGYMTSGVITGFGSVYINGIEFETDDTLFNVDDTDGTESQLKIGMYITLQGDINADGLTGQAASITFENEVEGIILAKNMSAGVGTLDVMGQTIVIDLDTQFESEIAGFLQIEDVQLSQVVEISGYSSGVGSIYATRVELKSAGHSTGEEMELKGVVTALNDTTFVIGAMMIDYTSATLEDFDTKVLADGMYVEVKSTDGINVDNQLVASKIELEGETGKGDQREDGEEMEIEGMVTSVVMSDGLAVEINGQEIVLNANTEYEYGSVDTLLIGAKVEVEGEFDSEGRFIADEIKFRQEAKIKMEAFVDSVNPDTDTVVVLGQTVKVNNLTFMEDDKDDNGAEPIKYFNLSHIVAGDFVEIKAYLDSNDELIAVKFERDDAEDDNEVKLEAVIDFVAESGLITVAGITVDMSALDSTTQFVVGAKVEIKGIYSSDVLVATEMSVDD